MASIQSSQLLLLKDMDSLALSSQAQVTIDLVHVPDTSSKMARNPEKEKITFDILRSAQWFVLTLTDSLDLWSIALSPKSASGPDGVLREGFGITEPHPFCLNSRPGLKTPLANFWSSVKN